MVDRLLSSPGRGIAVSDLHLFARRSAGEEYLRALQPQMASADVLVLNGDIFDFRWSTLSNLEITAARALSWLRALNAAYPKCEIHYVLGNHDCPAFFATQLEALARDVDRFHWHEFGVRLGTALFVHGDCTHRTMDPSGLRRFRADWDNDRQHGRWMTQAYLAVDRLGLTRTAHQCYFPKRTTVRRAMHYLDHAWPGWQEGTRDCYFGHTHQPFSAYQHRGIRFHNTGSAIRGMGFNPLAFQFSHAAAESLN